MPGIGACIDIATPPVCDAGNSHCRMAAGLFGADGVATE